MHPPVQHQARALRAQEAVANPHTEDGSVLVTPAKLDQFHKTVAGGDVLKIVKLKNSGDDLFMIKRVGID